MWFTRLAIDRPIVLIMAVAALTLLGLRARSFMPAEMDPPVDIPIIHVMTVYPGAGPNEVEERVSRPIEDAVGSVANVTSTNSISQQDVSFVTVRFELGIDLDAAAAEVRARLDAGRADLPDEIQSPVVSKVDMNARPVLVLGVTGERSLEELRELVDEEIKPALGQAPGVAGVQVVGGYQREVQIRVDPDSLDLAGLSLLGLRPVIAAASQSAPAGDIPMGNAEISVRVPAQFDDLSQIADIRLPTAGAVVPGETALPGAPLLLSEIAQVVDTVAARTQITRVGGRESIGLILTRLADANTVQVADHINQKLDDLRRTLPTDVRITTLQDNSIAVRDALDDVNVALILGAFLAVLVVFVFLHSLKDTLIVALQIPTSIIITFVAMYFAGFSLNQMSMLALALSVGILVDDAILVLECIHRHRAQGKSSRQAALDGRQEIGLADAANTFVDVVVFLPIAFMAGVVGQFFKQFGLTIAAASLVSLYLSFSLTPMLAAHLFRDDEKTEEASGGFARAFDRTFARLEAGYRKLLGWALRRRATVVLVGFGSLAAALLLAWQGLGFDFTPSIDRGEVLVTIEQQAGSTLASTDELLQQIEAHSREISEVDASRSLASAGEILGGFGAIPTRGPEFGQLTLNLIPKYGLIDRLLHPLGGLTRRHRSDEQIAKELRRRLRDIPGARINVSAVRGLTSALRPVIVELYARDLNRLADVGEQVAAAMAAVPDLRNVELSVRRGRPEIQVRIDRMRAGELGITAAELTGAVRIALEGVIVARLKDGERTYPIRLQLSPEARSRPGALQDLLVSRSGQSPVYLADVATLRHEFGPTKIERADRERRVLVIADLRAGVSLGAAQGQVESALGELDLGDVRWAWGGDVEDMADARGPMIAALLLAVALAYFLLAAVFNSVLQPLTIMACLPMALVGAILGLLVSGATLNIVSMIGIIMLVGLVAKNAILLVDYTNTLRQSGLSRDEAITTAGPVRLRPILMTTTATVLAMLPVALQIGRASEIRSPMAVTVIGGLIVSTLLTLLVVPVVYTYFDDFGEAVRRAWQREKVEESPRITEELPASAPSEAPGDD